MGYEELYGEGKADELAKAGLKVPAKEGFTCNGCPQEATCDLAWDLYNTDGDCLADK